jgi:flagellar protein FliO/FliZ
MSKPLSITFGSTLAALAGAPSAHAQAAAEAAGSGTFFGELVSILVPLVLIILVLLAGLHLARRRYGMTGQDAPLSVVQILPLGPRERIVLVRTRAGRVFAVGVAAQAVSLVTELDAADLVASHPEGSQAAAPATRATLFGKPLIRRDFSK